MAKQTNMQILLKAERSLSFHDATVFDGYLLGALSVRVDRLVWLQCIEAAQQFMERRKQEQDEAAKAEAAQ